MWSWFRPSETDRRLEELRKQLQGKREATVTRLQSKMKLVGADVEALYS